MKIRIMRNCAVSGQHREAGSIIEVDKQTAATLVTLKRAEYIEDHADKAAPETIEQRDPEVQNREPETAAPRTRKARANG